MSEQQPDALPSWVDRLGANQGATPPEAETALRRAVPEVMAVQDVTTAKNKDPMRFRGTLTMPSEEAFNRLRPLFEAVGHTPYMRKQNGLDAIYALPVVFGKGPHKVSRTALWLLIATIVCVFFTGMAQSDAVYIDPFTYIALQVVKDPSKIQGPTGRPLSETPDLIPTPGAMASAVGTGFLYVLALLGILGTHEMGHYIVARLNKVHTSPPYFIPVPPQLFGVALSPFGTLGAVILMQEPSRNRKVQFDIGVAGPLAGFIVAIPVMLIGLHMSTVGPASEFLSRIPASIRPYIGLQQEGQSLLYIGLKYLVFGRILPQGNIDVWIHPVAFAAWAGLLVTALNLMPAGQLDGGHVIYGLFGDWARKLRWPLMIILGIMVVAGFLRENNIIDLGFGWSGWVLWILIIYFLMRSPAPVLDEITRLDQKRMLLGLLTLVIFILIFTPTPLTFSGPAAPPPIPTTPPATQAAPVALMLLRGLFM